MNLKLSKPIVFFDIESTGLDPVKDRIIEISFVKVNVDGTEEVKTYRVNPEMKISEEATAVHHITNEDLVNEPTFREIGKEIANFIKGSDLGGFNSNRFDIPMLVEEFSRNNIDFDIDKVKFVDVQVIFHKMEQRTLSAAYKFYCGKELEGAHGASADTMATYEVLKAQLDKYPDDLTNDINFLSKFSRVSNNVDLAGRIAYNDNNIEVFNFGKYKGKPVVQVLEENPGYYSWIMKSDFSENTKNVLTRLKLSLKK